MAHISIFLMWKNWKYIFVKSLTFSCFHAGNLIFSPDFFCGKFKTQNMYHSKSQTSDQIYMYLRNLMYKVFVSSHIDREVTIFYSSSSAGPRIYAEKGASTILLTTLGMQVGGPQQTYDNGKTTTTMAKEKVVVGGNIDNIQVVVSSPSPIHRQPRKSISQVTEYFYDELMMAVSKYYTHAGILHNCTVLSLVVHI